MSYASNRTNTNFLRTGLRLVALAAVMAFAPAVAAQAASPAEAYVQSNVDRGLLILNSSSLSKEQKSAQFREFLLGLTDINRTAVFTLGPVKNTASPGDIAAFEGAFRDFAFAIYENAFSKYTDQTLRVTGSVLNKPNDWLVSTVLVDPHAKGGQSPLTVDFRVMGTPGHFTVSDVTVEGIDLAINEQEQFVAFLQDHNNDLKALTADLKQRAANVRASGSISGN